MANYSIKIDLLKVKGACTANLTGHNGKVKCLVIPIEGSGMYLGEKGLYLNMTAMEMRQARYEDTHLVKVSVSGAEYKAMTDEERRAVPILGGLHEMRRRDEGAPADKGEMRGPAAGESPDTQGEAQEDLPF